MIKRLQHKIVLIITLLLAISVVVLMLSINIMSQSQSNMRIRNNLEKIADDETLLTRKLILTESGQIIEIGPAYLWIKVDRFGNPLKTNLNVNDSFDEIDGETFMKMIETVLSSENDFGYIEKNTAYLFKTKPEYGAIMVFTDTSSENRQNETLLLTTSVIGAASVILFFLLAIALSFWLIKPVKETFDKQKQFISDASHELKTPIAVISANTDVLEAEIGENKWLGYIRSESVRMGELVSELLYLARIDDKTGHKMTLAKFNLTDAVLQTALPFESRMFEEGKKFEVNAQEDITCEGDLSAIKHVLTILIDNAIKYSEEKGEIIVDLKLHSNKKVLSVYNTGIGIKKDKLNKVFERFYREDEARNSQSGGYGLGLAIAAEVVARHHGTIKCESEYGKWVKFIVTLP